MGISRSIVLSVILFSACANQRQEPFQPRPAREMPAPGITPLTAVVETDPVPDDPDDPAIWIHPDDPAQSIVVGTNKVEKPNGAIAVFDLQGRILQTIRNLDRPNNIDIEQRVRWGNEVVDIAVVTEREAGAVRLYFIDPKTRTLSERASFRVFDGETGDLAAPMGIGIFKRADDAVFVVIGRKSGPAEGYLWEYQLLPDPSLKLVRKFGKFSGSGEIEAIVVDDELGYVYYADEQAGIRKYSADPDAPNADRELAFFGDKGYRGDREGLAIYKFPNRTGYLISTDQIEGGSRYFLYAREGTRANPHDHAQALAILEGSADSTDGVEAVSVPLSPLLRHGVLVAMNSGAKNFLFFDWPEQWGAGRRGD